jgi:hypothetical protein
MIGADSSMPERQLFQAGDDGSTPISALQFKIHPINHETARLWVERWHYSGRIPTGQNIAYGLFASGELYAVIVYGIGVNPYQASFLGVESVVEIKRMVRSEPPLSYQLSRFIALTLRMLKREVRFDAVVAFADPEHGHSGTVYKAAGFILEGKTGKEWHLIDKEGNKRHRRYAFRYARRNGISVAQARAQLGVERVITEAKFRWVKRFGPTSTAAPTGTSVGITKDVRSAKGKSS